MPQDFVNPFGSFLEGFRLGEDDELEKQEALRRQRALDLDFLLNSTERDFQRETVQTAFANDLSRIGVQHGNTVDLTTIRHGQNIETIGVQHGNTLDRDNRLHTQRVDAAGVNADIGRTDALIEGILSGRVTGPAAETMLEQQYGITSNDLAIPVYDDAGRLVELRPLTGTGSPVQPSAAQPTVQTDVQQPTAPTVPPSDPLAQPRAYEEDLWQDVYERMVRDHGIDPAEARAAIDARRGQQTPQEPLRIEITPSAEEAYQYHYNGLVAAGMRPAQADVIARQRAAGGQ